MALALHHFIFLWIVVVLFLATVALAVSVPRLRIFADFICRGSADKKHVALTFDDGPDPKSTPALLALLRERKIRAAFFGIGEFVAANPALADQIVREGHLLENHSYKHSLFTNCYPPKRMLRELQQTQEAIERATGIAPRYFRPPCGLTNSWTPAVTQRTDLRYVGWSIRSFDTATARPEKIVARIVRKLHPGAIILLHDGNIPAEKLITTISALLEALEKQGYEAVRLDALIAGQIPECERHTHRINASIETASP